MFKHSCRLLSNGYVIILLTAIDSQGQVSEFFYQPEKIELGFDVVSQIAVQNTTLINVQLIEQGHYMPLPLEAFDGDPLAVYIQKLEKEWTYLLEPPLQTNKQLINEEFLNWAYQQVDQCREYLTAINQMIDNFNKLIRESENFFSFREQPSKKADHFRFMLTQCELNRIRATDTYELAIKRINRLADQ